jgi:hypothetical protein
MRHRPVAGHLSAEVFGAILKWPHFLLSTTLRDSKYGFILWILNHMLVWITIDAMDSAQFVHVRLRSELKK